MIKIIIVFKLDETKYAFGFKTLKNFLLVEYRNIITFTNISILVKHLP